MSRYASLFVAYVAMSTATSVMGNDAPPGNSFPPDERYFAKTSSCETGDPNDFSLPCFSCMNIPPREDDPSDIVFNVTQAPSNAPTINPFKIESMLTHCNLDDDTIYTIYYKEKDCKGEVVFDQTVSDECPDCSGCRTTSDCGTQNCPATCCGLNMECSRCQNAGMCNLFPDECEECPKCSEPNPYCSYCTDSQVCAQAGSLCAGCEGCTNPPDPCKSCVSTLYCGYGYREKFCNNGACAICQGADPCALCSHSSLCTGEYAVYCGDGSCPICQSGGPSGRLLNELPKFPEVPEVSIPHIAIPDVEYYTPHRELAGGNPSGNFTTVANSGTPTQDTTLSLSYGSLFTNGTCPPESISGSALIPLQFCLEISEKADNQTLAVKVNCAYGANIQATVTGYASMDDCKQGGTTTFTETASDGSCISPPTNAWGMKVKCAGWGKTPPPPPPPPTPGPNDATYGVRVRYPDRRCVPETGKPVDGDIVSCNTCTAFPNQNYRKINCATNEISTYQTPDCSGTADTKPGPICQGLGPIRGIFTTQKMYANPSSVGFASIHSDFNGCWAENVVAYAGLKTGACTKIEVDGDQGMPFFATLDCSSNILSVYSDDECSGSTVMTIPFNNNQCIQVPETSMRIRLSCGAYQTPLPRPPTAAPTTAPSKAPTTAPTIPTASPTTNTPTKAPTTPTASPTTNTPTKAPTTPTASRTCTDVQRGCTGKATSSCAGQSATWSVEGVSNTCKCVSFEKSSKVAFKLQVAATTLSQFNGDSCNVVDIFVGSHKKIYDTTKSSPVNDFPVEVLTPASQSGNNVVIEFAVLGFVDTASADAVINFINQNSATIIAKIKEISAAAIGGSGIDISYVAGSARRIDNSPLCVCEKLLDVGSGAVSNNHANQIAQAIVAGMVAFIANQ